MKKFKLFLFSIFLQFFLFIIFRTNRWVVSGLDDFKKSIKSNQPIMLCSWHERFLYAVYFLKKYKIKNVWAVSSTHPDSQIMAYFLQRSSFSLIKGSSTRGWENVIKQMLRVFKESSSIVAITNDGPKGPPKISKLGSYKIAMKSGAKIIAISCSSSKFWKARSWDGLRIPKPFGTIYVDISSPMPVNQKYSNVTDASSLTFFLNEKLNQIDERVG